MLAWLPPRHCPACSPLGRDPRAERGARGLRDAALLLVRFVAPRPLLRRFAPPEALIVLNA